MEERELALRELFNAFLRFHKVREAGGYAYDLPADLQPEEIADIRKHAQKNDASEGVCYATLADFIYAVEKYGLEDIRRILLNEF
jgi:hypothetical protein